MVALWLVRMLWAGLLGALAACGGGRGAPGADLGTVGGPGPVACSVELNGDSILSGTGIEVAPAVGLARLRPGWVVVDRAVPGLTLADLYLGYGAAYAGGPVGRLGPQPGFVQVARSAGVVVVELGGNDAYGGARPEVFEAQLRAVVATIQAEGRVAVLTGVVPLVAGAVFDQGTVERALVLNAVTHRVAETLGAVHAGWDTVEWHGLAETVDGIHRTQVASDRLVARLAVVLDGVAAGGCGGAQSR